MNTSEARRADIAAAAARIAAIPTEAARDAAILAYADDFDARFSPYLVDAGLLMRRVDEAARRAA